MLTNPPLEKLLERADNRYTLTISVAKRTRQLVDGAQPLVETKPNQSLLTFACEEYAADTFVSLPGKLEPEIPLRPEVELAIEEAQRMAAEKADMRASYDPEEERINQPPVSKIRIMNPDEMFYMPYEEEDEDEKDEDLNEDLDNQLDEDAEDLDEDDEDLDENDEDEDDVDVDSSDSDEDEMMVSDEELDSIDGSIDDFSEDEDDDYV